MPLFPCFSLFQSQQTILLPADRCSTTHNALFNICIKLNVIILFQEEHYKFFIHVYVSLITSLRYLQVTFSVIHALFCFFILPEPRPQFRHWRRLWDIQTRPHQLGRGASGGACQLYPPVTQSETENQTNI